jgi:hypothetical protein
MAARSDDDQIGGHSRRGINNGPSHGLAFFHEQVRLQRKRLD